jgi:hypothetical protein
LSSVIDPRFQRAPYVITFESGSLTVRPAEILGDENLAADRP